MSGRAKCNIETIRDYEVLYKDDFASVEQRIKEERVGFAERVLGEKRPHQFQGIYYGETPVVMVTEQVRNLTQYVERRLGAPWQDALTAALPWTEYPLYFQFLENAETIDTVYQLCDRNAVMRFDQTIWHNSHRYRVPRTLDTLDMNEVFSPTNPLGGYFIAIESYLQIPLEAIAAAVLPHLSP